jgi:prepilin-type N-terminal cleavage/methylation domain-containing protein
VTGRARRRRAFTLLEVLVALALIAGGGIAVLRLVRSGVEATAADGAYTAALFAAIDELARARLDPPPPGTETSTRGTMRLERWTRTALDPSLLEVRVRATPANAVAGIELVEIIRAPPS